MAAIGTPSSDTADLLQKLSLNSQAKSLEVHETPKKLEQGIQVLKIFKSHLSKTTVLDDFEFYEGRHKALQEKKAKKQQYQKQDKISQLPDDILLNFLSTLDLKTAVQTSILAKRWRYLWTLRTNLDLDSCNMSPYNFGWIISKKIGPKGYVNWVNQIINAHRSPFITKFRVIFDNKWRNYICHVEKWVRFALSKRVEVLELDLSCRQDALNFSLGFDILKHPPCYNGIANLKSLWLSSVNVSGENLEFILLQCHLLEQLHVFRSYTLHTLNIVSYKLKHLTLVDCGKLKELVIDVVNLISFRYGDNNNYGVHTDIMFKCVPNLVEMDFRGHGCVYPFPILEQLSYLPKQLTKLSFSLSIDFERLLDKGPWEIDVHFPNVKQLTFSFSILWTWLAIVFIKLFIDACPMLHELQIQVRLKSFVLEEEAKQLREIELEDERVDEMSKDQNSYSAAQKEQVVNHVERDEYENKSHPNLKVLEVVGFDGCESDVVGVLDMIATVGSIETFICDIRYVDSRGEFLEVAADVEMTDNIRRRARKLAKLVPPNVRVGVRDRSGISWVS